MLQIKLMISLRFHREAVRIIIQMGLTPPYPCVVVLMIIFMGRRHVVMRMLVVMMMKKRMKFITSLILKVKEAFPLILVVMVIIRVRKKAGGRMFGRQARVDFQR